MDGLARLRRSRGHSQRSLAEEAGLAISTIYQVETRQHAPSPTTLRKLAKALGVSIAQVLEATEDPEAHAAPERMEDRLAPRLRRLEQMDLSELSQRLAKVKEQIAELKVDVPYGGGTREEVTDFPLYLELTDEALALAMVLERKASKQLA
jgi:transcriptional regulator with XRE-family HTH domain